VFQRVDSRGGEHCGSFGDIDRTTATESQYGIAARVGQQRHSGAHPLDRWLCRDSERDASDAGFGQRRPDCVRTGCRTPGHHQDSACPHPGECVRYLADPASPEPYVGRNREIEVNPRGYQSESSGEVLTYRVASRGLAIMSATVSRHRW
jgi:hypothetical protein